MGVKLNVVTGATGLLGSHIVEHLAAQGEHVRALVRSTSEVTFLRQRGVELVPGDLQDPDSIRRVVAGADVVFHCAARVGDWGSWKLFHAEVIDTTRNLIDACRAAAVGRILYVSSVAAYGHPRERPDWLTEEEPLGQRLRIWDHYCRAKMLAEVFVRGSGLPVTIVRPSWIYGPRDRNTFPRVVRALRGGWVSLLGSGDNLLNIVYAADVAEGAIRAANHPEAIGRAYHLCSEGEVTQRQFVDALTEALHLPSVTRRVPRRLAYWGGFFGEAFARLTRWNRAPYITRYSVGLISRPVRFSIARARIELGWQPRVHPLEGLRRTLEWFEASERPACAPPVGEHQSPLVRG
jgi:nucleoside-diphosphate-sugar epimerase